MSEPMSEPEQTRPRPADLPTVRVEFVGQQPPIPGILGWCASCATRYMGDLAQNPFVKRDVQIARAKAEAQGDNVIYVDLPDLEFFPLRPAIAYAPSVIFPNHMYPTCWVHILPLTPDDGREHPNPAGGPRLVQGKTPPKRRRA